MLSHDNITWNAYSIGTRLPNIEYGKEVLVTFLPLSHIAAQIVDIVLSLTFAATIYFADKDALKVITFIVLDNLNQLIFILLFKGYTGKFIG